MAKHLQRYIAGRSGAAIEDVAMHEPVAGGERTREYLRGLAPRERNRVLAIMLSFKTYKEVAELAGVTMRVVERAAYKNRDIVKSARIGRNVAIAGLAERKAIELLEGMDVSQIPHEKKPQSIKYLVDAADIANQHVVPKKEEQEDDTYELLFRVKAKMGKKPPLEKSDDNADAVDAEFEEVKPKQLPGGKK